MLGTEYVRTNDDLVAINKQILQLGKELNKPVVATGTSTFCAPRIISTAVSSRGAWFRGCGTASTLYFRTTEEMLAEFPYLTPEDRQQVVVANTKWVADQCEDLTPVPQGLHPPKIEAAEEMLREMTYENAHKLYGNPCLSLSKRAGERTQLHHWQRLRFALWIAHKLVKKSLDDGYLVDPGFSRVFASSTMCGITEVNPLPPHYACPKCQWSQFFTMGEYPSGPDLPERECPHCGTPARKLGFDIPFEVFMGFHGDKVPDIDLNFSGEYQAAVHRYTEELFGREHVFRAGTIGTLAEKTAYGFVMKYLEQIGETRRSAEVNRLVTKITGVRRTTGQHPGGMMVVPEDMDIHDFTPIQYPANDGSSGIITTHFDYHAIHDSLVKLDILGHDDPTMLRMLEDLTGVNVQEIP